MSGFALFLGLGAVLFGVSACEDRGTDEASSYAAYFNQGSSVSFSQLETQVLAPSCVQCHAGFTNEEGIRRLVVPGDPGASPLYTMVASGKMPKNSHALSPALVAMISTYIEQLPASAPPEPGPSPEPSPGPSSSPPPALAPTWASLSVNLFEISCTKCHHSGSGGRQPYLDNYASVVNAADDIYSQIEYGNMPPGNETPTPSAATLQTFLDWQQASFPQ